MKNSTLIHLKSGQSIEIRLLESGDTAALAQYFASLSAETLRRYGPHPFTNEQAEIICAQASTDPIYRVIAISNHEIIAYLLLKPGLLPEDHQRLKSNHFDLNIKECLTFAPSVADAWQNSGIGSLAMDFCLQIAAQANRRTVVLWGGVQATNHRAVHFYQKYGFVKTGEFLDHNGVNYDMVLEIISD